MFRTNNCAEAFHDSLKTTFPSPRPNFSDFVEKLSEIMDRAEHEFNVERVNSKRMKMKALTTNAKIKQLIDIFNAQDVLPLELPEPLDGIGSLLGESSRFESRFEDSVKASLSSSTPTSARRAKFPWSLMTMGSLFNRLKIIKLKRTNETIDRMFWKMGSLNKRSWNKGRAVRKAVDKKSTERTRENKKYVLG